MTDGLSVTDYFGFTRIGQGETISKNGWAALDADRVVLAKLLNAAFNRSFTGEPALGDPTDGPTLALNATGGNLPAGTTLYYKVAFVDVYGLESAASPEASITTDAPIAAPTAPALAVLTDSGTIGTGTFSYVITVLDTVGGETTVSPLASVQIASGTTNRIQLSLPELPAGGGSINIYRARPGQTAFYHLANTTGSTYIDTGSAEDQTVTAPSVNTTNGQTTVTVTIPGAFIPEGCASWRIYRATTSGGYTSASLVHQVVEPATDSSPTPVTQWTDAGDALLTGYPRDVSCTAPQGPVLNLENLSGSLPVDAVPRGVQCLSAASSGAIVNSKTVTITESPRELTPVRFTTYFATPPTEAGVTVRVRVSDSATPTANYIELPCSATTHGTSDPTGYFHAEYPLLLDAEFQAETGTRSASSVLIDNDLAASDGQAVMLLSQNDWVEVDLGALDTGSYQAYARLRVLSFDTVNPGNDITISVIRTDTMATVGTPVTVNLQSTTPGDPASTPTDFMYQELTGPAFTAPGGVDLVLRVTKSTTSTQSYDVDYMRYHATVAALNAGTLTVTTYIDGGTTAAADAQICLWF